jgi:hypothetical protein
LVWWYQERMGNRGGLAKVSHSSWWFGMIRA